MKSVNQAATHSYVYTWVNKHYSCHIFVTGFPVGLHKYWQWIHYNTYTYQFSLLQSDRSASVSYGKWQLIHYLGQWWRSRQLSVIELFTETLCWYFSFHYEPFMVDNLTFYHLLSSDISACPPPTPVMHSLLTSPDITMSVTTLVAKTSKRDGKLDKNFNGKEFQKLCFQV